MGPGDLVRTHHRRDGLSQLELAGRAGLCTRQLSYVERGRSQPGRAVLAALARAMDPPPGEATRVGLEWIAGWAQGTPLDAGLG